jgi:hypothetical protein
MSLLSELNGTLLTESGLPLLAENETDSGTGTGTGNDPAGQITLKAKAALQLFTHAALNSIKVFTSQPIKAKATLWLIGNSILKSRRAMKAKAALRVIARQGTAQTPSGLGMQMKIIADPFRPDVILDQVLLVWFNGHPNYCKVALKIDDGAELLTAFTWQNPGVTCPAVIKIDSAAIAGDGQNHRLKIRVWQQVAGNTSASAIISDYAKTPIVRPATQPEWCGATGIRQGETLRNAGGSVCGHIGDLTRVEWRHQGAVQIMAKIPTIATRRVGNVSHWYWKEGSVITIAYCDHDETSFTVEDIGISMGWMNGLLHDVLFGVASIHNGQFGPVTWANAPVKIREILNKPTGQPLTPDQAAGTARLLQLDLLKEEIGQELFTEKGWIYPDYLATGTVNTQRRDVVKSAIDKALFRIKEATRRGGSVTLDNLGRFEARWNPDRTVRSVSFVASPGFIKGTKNGIILTDSQTKQE